MMADKANAAVRFREVRWFIPKNLYDELAAEQETHNEQARKKNQPVFPTVGDFAMAVIAHSISRLKELRRIAGLKERLVLSPEEATVEQHLTKP